MSPTGFAGSPTSARLTPKTIAKKSTCKHIVARERVEQRRWNDVENEAANAAAVQLVGVFRIG